MERKSQFEFGLWFAWKCSIEMEILLPTNEKHWRLMIGKHVPLLPIPTNCSSQRCWNLICSNFISSCMRHTLILQFVRYVLLAGIGSCHYLSVCVYVVWVHSITSHSDMNAIQIEWNVCSLTFGGMWHMGGWTPPTVNKFEFIRSGMEDVQCIAAVHCLVRSSCN